MKTANVQFSLNTTAVELSIFSRDQALIADELRRPLDAARGQELSALARRLSPSVAVI